MKKKSKYRNYILIIIISAAILAITLILTSQKLLQADRNFTQLILEENKAFLISTLRFGHGLMAQTGVDRYDDLIDLALKSKFIHYLAVLDKEGTVIAQSESLSLFGSRHSYDTGRLGDGVILQKNHDFLLISYEGEKIVSKRQTKRHGARPAKSKGEAHIHPSWFLVGLDISVFEKHYHDTLIQTVGVGAGIFLFGTLIIIFFGILQRYELANLSIERLQKIERVLSNFVPDIAKKIIKRDPEKALLDKYIQDATVLFLDIEGFSTFLQRYPQEKVNRAVEFYFSLFFDLIQKYEGDINETAGDGMMVIFLHPDPKQHAINAVQTALEINKKCRQVSKMTDDDLFPIQVNIGISSGKSYLGSTKIRGSRGDRWTFTASGSVTILAARLSEFGHKGQILSSEETARRINGRFSMASLGKVVLKNLQDSGEIFQIKSP